MGLLGIIIAALVVIYVLTIILGLDFIISIISQNMWVIMVILVIIGAIKCFLATDLYNSKTKKAAKIVGLPIVFLCSVVSDIIFLISLCGLGQWYLDSAKHDILSAVAMLTIGLAIFLIFVGLLAGIQFGALYVLIDDGIDLLYGQRIALYVLISILSVILSTGLIYYVDYDAVRENFHSGFFSNLYAFFVQINPVNWLIDVFNWHFLN